MSSSNNTISKFFTIQQKEENFPFEFFTNKTVKTNPILSNKHTKINPKNTKLWNVITKENEKKKRTKRVREEEETKKMTKLDKGEKNLTSF